MDVPWNYAKKRECKILTRKICTAAPSEEPLLKSFYQRSGNNKRFNQY